MISCFAACVVFPKQSLFLSSPKSQSTFSILTDEILAQHDKAKQSAMLCTQGLKKDEIPSVAPWNQNIDWMENSCKA